MITIRGTRKIKGALDLSGINKQLKSGDALPISDEDFNDHTVQLAVSMKYITYEKGGLVDLSNRCDVKVRNIYDRPIRLNALDGEIRPGQTFTLTEDQINSADIRGALAKGMLAIVSSARSLEDTTESTIRVGSLFDGDDEPDEPVEESLEEESRYLETNEEVTDPAVIDIPDPNPVEKEDIPDPKGKTVIWNPTHKPVSHTKAQMESVSVSQSGEAKAIPGRSGETEALETNIDISDEISFVDHAMDAVKRAAHPILKDKPKEDDDGIDFL